jgi:predicted Rossmann fold flavoprotein
MCSAGSPIRRSLQPDVILILIFTVFIQTLTIDTFDVLILGAGAAGLMCAIEAGKRGRRVAILERAERAGKKILISGGGRCNFTNIHCQPENFLSSNPHFAKSALARYTPADFIALVEKHHIPYHEKTLGQLFCDRSSRNILQMLEEECRAANVRIFLSTKIEDVSKSTEFIVRATHNSEPHEFRAATLVVATGGLSIPKMGATSFGYDLAKQFGLKIQTPRPALVPLLFNKTDHANFADLAGASAEVEASCQIFFAPSSATNSFTPRFREKMLFTHRGLSGPAILQISSYWKHGESISLDLAPGKELTDAFRNPKLPRSLAGTKSEFRKFLPLRFADRWVEHHSPTSWTNHDLAELERKAHAWTIIPAGTEGYGKAEVTTGGVDTDELSSKTMESKRVPGLFFIGEVVDVTGHLGGFNFQWAWASGVCTGQAV